MTNSAPRTRILAWALGLAGAAGCAFALAWTVALGLYVPPALGYLTLMVTGLLGALIASRAPSNSIGWLMCAFSLWGVLLLLPFDYGYTAQVLERGSWPLGAAALWFEAWAWVPILMVVPLVSVRFPDGRVPPGWRAVDWAVAVGTVGVVASVALASPAVLAGFIPSRGQIFSLLTTLIQNPLGPSLPETFLGSVRLLGMALIVLGYVLAVAALTARFRRARGEERLQLKWFAYAGVLMAAALIFGALITIASSGGVAPIVVGRHLGDALIPFTYATIALPLALGIAILRYRLYNIDLIINRTLVYGGLTTILGAVYVGVITFLNRMFISVSGQKSDAAYVLTAFVVVGMASPVKDWLQGRVDLRLGTGSPQTVLDRFRSEVETVVSVLDVHRVACSLVDQAVLAFDARGAALYLRSGDADPLYSRGHPNDQNGIEIPLRHDGQVLGRLVLAGRRGDSRYTKRDREVLQRSADIVGEALALAEHLGHPPLRTAR